MKQSHENPYHPYRFRGGEHWRNPFDDYQALRDDHPVHEVDHHEFGRFWVLSRFADVFDALRDTQTFSSASGLTPGDDAMAMFEDMAAPIVMLDPPEHTAMRRLVNRPMTPRSVADIEPEVREFVAHRLAQISTNTGSVDIIDLLFKPLPSFVVAHYLGVPVSDRERFDGWTNAIVAANAEGDVTSAPEAALDLFAYASELIAHRRAHPGEDVLSDLATNPDVTDMWIVGFIFTMVAGGNDTTTGLLGGAAELLTTNPDQRRLLIDDPSLISGSVDEFLRLTSPVQNLARTTTTDIQIEGVDVPAGHKVLLHYGAANRDPREFGDGAEALNVQRAPSRILSLGYGAHHCLGAAAARLQATVVLEELLTRFPNFEVDVERATYAPGAFVRRHATLPFRTGEY